MRYIRTFANGLDPASVRDLAVAILARADWRSRTISPGPRNGPSTEMRAATRANSASCVEWLESRRGRLLRDRPRGPHSRRFARVHELVDLIARALELKDELSADDLRWLIGEDRLKRYGIGEADEVQAG